MESSKWKRKRSTHLNLEKARQAKGAKLDQSNNSPVQINPLEDEPIAIPPVSDDESNSESENEECQNGFTSDDAKDVYSEWIRNLERDDQMMLSTFLMDLLINNFAFKVLESSKIVAKVVNKTERTIRSWKGKFYMHCGSFGPLRKGKYSRSSILDEEDIREKSLAWLRSKAYSKSGTRLSAKIFQLYVNDELLPTADLPGNYCKSISLRTAYRWLAFQGFHYKKDQKGAYVDGNEREDVVTYRNQFIRKIDIL